MVGHAAQMMVPTVVVLDTHVFIVAYGMLS